MPLLFLGARQVGKTYILQEFGKSEYRQMIYVNFEDKDAPKDIFLQGFNINRIIALLNAYSGLTITPDDTLLVFDEIQSVPQGITSLKYFCENAREYHIIAAGSFRTSLSDYRKESWTTNVPLYIIRDYFD